MSTAPDPADLSGGSDPYAPPEPTPAELAAQIARPGTLGAPLPHHGRPIDPQTAVRHGEELPAPDDPEDPHALARLIPRS